MPITKEKLSEISLLFSKVLAWVHIVVGTLGVVILAGTLWFIKIKIKNDHCSHWTGVFGCAGHLDIAIGICVLLCVTGIGALESLPLRKLNFIFGIILFAFSLFANSHFIYFSFILPVVVLVFTIVVLIRYFRSDKLLAVWVTIAAIVFTMMSFISRAGLQAVKYAKNNPRSVMAMPEGEQRKRAEDALWAKWQSCDTVLDCEIDYSSPYFNIPVNKRYHEEFSALYKDTYRGPNYWLHLTHDNSQYYVKMDKLFRKSLGGLMACEKHQCVDKLPDCSELIKLYKSTGDITFKEYVLGRLSWGEENNEMPSCFFKDKESVKALKKEILELLKTASVDSKVFFWRALPKDSYDPEIVRLGFEILQEVRVAPDLIGANGRICKSDNMVQCIVENDWDWKRDHFFNFPLARYIGHFVRLAPRNQNVTIGDAWKWWEKNKDLPAFSRVGLPQDDDMGISDFLEIMTSQKYEGLQVRYWAEDKIKALIDSLDHNQGDPTLLGTDKIVRVEEILNSLVPYIEAVSGDDKYYRQEEFLPLSSQRSCDLSSEQYNYNDCRALFEGYPLKLQSVYAYQRLWNHTLHAIPPGYARQILLRIFPKAKERLLKDWIINWLLDQPLTDEVEKLVAELYHYLYPGDLSGETWDRIREFWSRELEKKQRQ